MKMPGREYESVNGVYRYGFNGQEKSDEVGPNTTTAEFWEYDARLGRRWNIDPVNAGQTSGYSTFANNPMFLVDPNGADTTEHGHRYKDLNDVVVRSGSKKSGGSSKAEPQSSQTEPLANRAFAWANQSPDEIQANKKWEGESFVYGQRRDKGMFLSDAGEGLTDYKLDSYERDYQATISWKQGELFWVGVVAGPYVASEAIGSGAINYLFGWGKWNWGVKGVVAASDVLYQFSTNENHHVNILQTASSAFGPLGYALGSSSTMDIGTKGISIGVADDASLRKIVLMTVFNAFGKYAGNMEGAIPIADGPVNLITSAWADNADKIMAKKYSKYKK